MQKGVTEALQVAERAWNLHLEKELCLFTCAWDTGDFATLAAFWERAQEDQELAESLQELEEALLEAQPLELPDWQELWRRYQELQHGE